MENFNDLLVKPLSSDEINKIEEFRKSKQTAILAILFSDIVDSTYAIEKLGEHNFSKLRHLHDELFIRIMSRDKAGIIIKEIGDSFLCVFAEPSTAVVRAIEFQRAIYSNKEHLTVQDYALTVKIGIHVGQVAIENSLALDIFGTHVNRAARIEAIANGGQILTSLSIWENTVGLLKDNNEERIEWISYGKTKLKGIKGRIDIFGFYPKEIGKPQAPKIIRKQKQNRTLLILTAFVVLAVLSVFMAKRISLRNDNKEAVMLPSVRKSYYVQFDFSEIAKEDNGNLQKSTLDTSALKESLLTQIIAVLNPDSVITESDLVKSFSRKGSLYVRHYNHNSQESGYFRDTLKLSGAIFIKAKANSNQNNDSIQLHTRMDMYPTSNSSNAVEDGRLFSLKNLENDFRNDIQDMLMSTNLSTIQGYVLNSNDSIILFRKTKGSNLREGAAISFMREYIGMKGLHERLDDIKKRIAYHKMIPQDSSIIKGYLKEYDVTEKNISESQFKGRLTHSIELKGKVIELYDTTGKATWTLTGEFPYEKPKSGDLIYLTY